MVPWVSLLRGEEYGDTSEHCFQRRAEMVKILDLEGSQASRFFAITDGGRDRQTDYLSVQKLLIGLFLHHDMDEVLMCRPAAGLLYHNPVERV